MASDMTESDARQIKGVVEEAEEKMKRDEVYLGHDKDGAVNTGFPARYFARKDDEKKVRLLQEYTAALNTEGRLPTIYAPTEQDMNVLMRKDAEKELMNFENFLQTYFDLDNPIHQKLLDSLYPNYFKRRWEVIVDKLKIQEKIAKLKLLGPQTPEDLMFMYALHNGDIEIPTEVVFDTSKNEANNQTRFNRGFFNIHHWTSEPYVTDERIEKHKVFTEKGNLGGSKKPVYDVASLIGMAAQDRRGAKQEKAKNVMGQFKTVFGGSS